MNNIVYFLLKKTSFKRNKIKKMIKKGFLKIDNILVFDINHELSLNEVVEFDVYRFEYLEEKIVILNKPKWYECSKNPKKYKSAYELVDDESLIMVGRLDVDTTGLLLFRQNGTLANEMLLPESKKEKVYIVKLRDDISIEQIIKLESDMIFDNGVSVFASKVIVIEDKIIKLTITQGKFHQIKIMLKQVGNKSVEIHRVKFDGYQLGDLSLGKTKIVTPR